MRLTLPQHLEVTPGFFKLALDCNYAEAWAAMKAAQDPCTQDALQRLCDLNGGVWKRLPLMTIADMAGMVPRAYEVNLTDTIVPKDRPH